MTPAWNAGLQVSEDLATQLQLRGFHGAANRWLQHDNSLQPPVLAQTWPTCLACAEVSCMVCCVPHVLQDVVDALPLAGFFLLTLIIHEAGHRCEHSTGHQHNGHQPLASISKRSVILCTLSMSDQAVAQSSLPTCWSAWH